MIEQPTEVKSPDAASRVRARISDVLKSGVERELTIGGLDLATHSSHVVSEVAPHPTVDGELAAWDEERFQEFATRLSELRSTL